MQRAWGAGAGAGPRSLLCLVTARLAEEYIVGNNKVIPARLDTWAPGISPWAFQSNAHAQPHQPVRLANSVDEASRMFIHACLVFFQ